MHAETHTQHFRSASACTAELTLQSPFIILFIYRMNYDNYICQIHDFTL
uniref:Uncharacterized protein n=1 Tax=Arundo donax TaxID=35708 RepID=A0A0A9GXW5_ARUDO